MRFLKSIIILTLFGFCSIANAKMQYFRLDTNLSKQKGVYVLVAKFTVAQQGGSSQIDSFIITKVDSSIQITSFVTTGPLPAGITTYYDTIFLQITFSNQVRIKYAVNVWAFGKYIINYNRDSLYLTSDFLSIRKRNKAPESRWKIYPNPANDYVQVFNENQGLLRQCNYTIYDANGTRMLGGDNPLSGMLDLRDLGAGLYFIRFSDEYEMSENIKLMITK